ncbi:MAG: hypothetical protein V1898_00350 [Patescibacteria group bacterium]
MNDLEQIKKELGEIKSRNNKVEGDKAWETSWSRKIILMIFTYIAIAVYLYIINVDKPWLNAIVPAIAFMLSTLTMPYIKKIWLSYIYRK